MHRIAKVLFAAVNGVKTKPAIDSQKTKTTWLINLNTVCGQFRKISFIMTSKIKFNGSEKPTVCMELELFTLDEDSLALTNGAPLILNHFKDNFFFKEELLQCIVEITTDVNPEDEANNGRGSNVLYLSILLIIITLFIN